MSAGLNCEIARLVSKAFLFSSYFTLYGLPTIADGVSICQIRGGDESLLAQRRTLQGDEGMALSFSTTAAQEMQNYLAQRGGGLGIRLMVQTSECDGMTYRLEFVDEADEYDLMYESHGAKIYIDPKSLVYVDGTEIGYSSEGDEGGFSINNPNVKNHCGCGESFYV